MTEQTGPELVLEIGTQPTLEELLDRDPHAVPHTDEELLRLVLHQRAERAQFNIKEEKARAKRAGVEEILDDKANSDGPVP